MACGSVEGGVANPGTGADASAEGGAFDTGVADSSQGDSADTGADVDGGLEPPTALFVQASPSLPDVRVCWAVGTDVTSDVPFPGSGAMPGSNYPGIPLGGALADDDATDLLGGPVTLYAIDAENLARIEQEEPTPFTCNQLICGAGPDPAVPCLRANEDYWPVQALPAGALTRGATNVVAMSGCLPSALDPAASVARCGAEWTALAGNLHAEVAHVAPTATADAGELAFQAVLLSPALASALGDAGAVVSFGGPDGGTPVATLATEDDVEPPVAAVVSLGAGLAVFGELGFSVDAPGVTGGREWMSLAQAQQLVDPTQDPTVFFGQPRTYVVAVLGDPTAPPAFGDGGFDGTGLHLLVLATPAPGATPP